MVISFSQSAASTVQAGFEVVVAGLGEHVDGPGQPQSQMVRRCQLQMLYESRITGYRVIFEFAGKQYGVQLPSDPGPFIQPMLAPVIPAPGRRTARPLGRPMAAPWSCRQATPPSACKTS